MGIVGACVLAMCLFFLTLWIEHNSALELPSPTGAFDVGRVSTYWTDSSRVDPFAADTTEKRTLAVWIWYPTTKGATGRRAEYLPDSWRQALAKRAGFAVTQLFFRDPRDVVGHSVADADVSSDSAIYPVVIFNSGIGALSLQYATIIEDLVSHGYIVVGTDKPYSTSVVLLPDGRAVHNTGKGNPGDGRVPDADLDRTLQTVMEVWTADSRFVLDQMARLNSSDPAGKFIGRMNLNAIGVMGHSIGGATAVQFCHADSRCQAGVDIDGRLYGTGMRDGIKQPFLFLLADYKNSWSTATCDICAGIRAAAAPNQENKLIVTMIGAQHFSFGDQILTQSQILRSILFRISGQGRLNARDGLTTTARYLREFFQVQLRRAPRTELYNAPLLPNTRFERKSAGRQ
jgi:dienelactone hydrolase